MLLGIMEVSVSGTQKKGDLCPLHGYRESIQQILLKKTKRMCTKGNFLQMHFFAHVLETTWFLFLNSLCTLGGS